MHRPLVNTSLSAGAMIGRALRQHQLLPAWKLRKEALICPIGQDIAFLSIPPDTNVRHLGRMLNSACSGGVRRWSRRGARASHEPSS